MKVPTRGIFLSTALGALSLLSCKPWLNNISFFQTSQPKQPLPPEFCTTTTDNAPLWNAERVQREITTLLQEKGHQSSGLSVYSEIYLVMTRERDKARCDPKNEMYPTGPLQRRLNDALADMMSKGLVTSHRQCLLSFSIPQRVIPTIGQQLCELNREAVQNKWSSMELAMGSTALYLTSIMGFALSAIPHVEALWLDTPYRRLDTRIEAMKTDFKPVYDSFNLFLSNNVHTVADVLIQNNRIDCALFKWVARGAEVTRTPTLLFQGIRDTTFQRGLELARAWPLGLHPFTTEGNFWNVERVFPPFTQQPSPTFALEAHARDTVARLKNPFLKIFKGLDASTYVSGQGLTCPIPAHR